jgi:hypothetical protein
VVGLSHPKHPKHPAARLFRRARRGEENKAEGQCSYTNVDRREGPNTCPNWSFTRSRRKILLAKSLLTMIAAFWTPANNCV